MNYRMIIKLSFTVIPSIYAHIAEFLSIQIMLEGLAKNEAEY